MTEEGDNTGGVGPAIRDRLAHIDVQLATLRAERDTLHRFLEELNHTAAIAGPAAPGAGATAAPAARRRRRSKPTARSSGRNGTRRPGGQAAIVAHLAAHPTASAGDIALGTGLERNLVYSILSRLAARGEVERLDEDGGPKQYRLAGSVTP